jgi:ABC-type dipeptide/oligopeptide/nickel transport system permease component
MGRYIIRRLLYMVVVILVVSIITFGLMHAIPGGPFSREKALPAATIKVLNERYHLDDPLWKQYVDYIYNVLVPHITTKPPSTSLSDDNLINIKIGKVWIRMGNFGPSFKSRSRTVNDIFRDNLPISAQWE